jgi:TonB-dependent starch-binding outer membrane protein SusC
LPGVSIVIKGTTIGVITDMDGKYSINASTGDLLEFSFVGYLTETFEVKDQTTIDVLLVPNIQEMDEVVVVGYGKQKKSLVTGAIAKISEDDIVKTPALRAEFRVKHRGLL